MYTKGQFNSIEGKENFLLSIGKLEQYNGGVLTEEIIEQFKHRFNLYTIYGNKGIEEYEKELLKKGITIEQLNKMRGTAIRMSNWNGVTFVKDEVERTPKGKYYEVKVGC